MKTTDNGALRGGDLGARGASRVAKDRLAFGWPLLFTSLLALHGCNGADDGDSGKSGDPSFQGKAASCPEAALRCQGLQALETCSQNQWRPTACGAGTVCEDGACLPQICEPNMAICLGELGSPGSVAVCSPRGTSLLPATLCASGHSCAGGTCVPDACKPGATLCTDGGLGTCRADGSGFDIEPCSAGLACHVEKQVASCVALACASNAYGCDGAIQTLCNAKGTHSEQIRDCASEGKVCESGACVALTCVPGVVACDGAKVATCNADAKGWTVTTCAAGFGCKEGSCQAQVCIPGEVFCADDRPATCNSDGFAFDAAAPCSDGQSCKQGACVGEKTTCGDGLCDGSEASACPDDCGALPVTTKVFDALSATTPISKPRAPRALTATLPPAWTSGRAMALHGGKLFIIDADNGALVVMDAAKLTIEATLPVGKRPESLLVGPDGAVYVSVRDEAKVVRFAYGAWQGGQGLPLIVGFEPTGIAMSVDGKVLYVALGGEDAIVAVTPDKGQTLGRWTGVSRPQSLLVRADGTIIALAGRGEAHIAPALDFTVKLEEVKKGTVTPPLMGSCTSIGLRTFNPVPVCRDKLTIEARGANRAIAATIDPEKGTVLISHVLVANGSAEDVLDAAGLKPVDIPQPPKVICSGGYGSTCHVVPPPPGKPPCVGAPVRPYEVTISSLPASASALAPMVKNDKAIVDPETGRSILTRFDQPADIVHHPTHTLALIAGRGSNNVLVVNTAASDPMRWPLADFAVGAGPRSIVIAPKGDVAYVLCGHEFKVHRIALGPLLALAPTGTIPTNPEALPEVAPLLLGSETSAAYGVDPLPADAALGRKIFHFARNPRLSGAGRFACGTCHREGEEDHTVWFIAEGPRQTPALAGRLHDTAPFNWLGTKFKLVDNVINTTARMGGTGLLPQELTALSAFLLKGLQPPPNPNLGPGGLTAQQIQGKAIFDDPKVECSKCHVPGSGTDGAMHDVGTATDVEIKVAAKEGLPKPTYNTPSLRGIWYTSPYLHDGSAKTLHDALKKTATTMGKTSHLSPAQLDALVAYLKTL